MTLQKARDAALMLPLLGVLLLLPPFVGLLKGVAGFADIPAIALYIFVVWAALISTGFLLARRLREHEEAAAGSGITDDADA